MPSLSHKTVAKQCPIKHLIVYEWETKKAAPLRALPDQGSENLPCD